MKSKNYQYILVFDLFYYLLYVKVEKYAYLRFFNDYTGCQTDDTINEGNHESN